MDGIFGVGVFELLIIVLAMFIIGGPQNTAKWAREMGRMVRKARETWSEFIAEVETELGPEGKEIMDASRELSKGVRQMSNMSPAKRLVGETMRAVETSLTIPDEDAAQTTAAPDASPTPASTPTGESSSNGNYRAWLPPEK
ncbi:MAG: hypothetical protein JW966_00955 [Anaerolineae bacterium]|nr:hypothetical protein [Anaerolineae bacterium]